jgi:hypothetical protein
VKEHAGVCRTRTVNVGRNGNFKEKLRVLEKDQQVAPASH